MSRFAVAVSHFGFAIGTAICLLSPRWWKSLRESAPSNHVITGRHILQTEIFDILAAEKRGAGNEIQLTDAMIELARTLPF